MPSPDREVSEEAAVRIAQEECLRRGIPWREPFTCKKGWRTWEVRMPSNQRGGNATILVSRTTGEVKIRHYAR